MELTHYIAVGWLKLCLVSTGSWMIQTKVFFLLISKYPGVITNGWSIFPSNLVQDLEWVKHTSKMSVSVFHQMLYDLAGGTATSDKIEGHNLSQKVVVTNLVSPSVGVFQMLYLVFGKLCFLFETVYLVIGKAYLVYISVKTSRIT